MSPEAVRIDVWLWRTRFFKSRAAAARFADEGRIRLIRSGVEHRVDKAARTVQSGDALVFVLGGRLSAVRVIGAGVRRGSAQDARTLYEPLQNN